MERLDLEFSVDRTLGGSVTQAIVGVVASGNLEVLAERTEAAGRCRIAVSTSAAGFGEVWEAVLADFVARRSPGGVRFSINDGGARPDTVMLRLMQAARALERSS